MGLFTVGLRDDDFEPAYKFPALPHRVRGRCLVAFAGVHLAVHVVRDLVHIDADTTNHGVIDVDSFTSFYTSVRNRRMSRAGKVLEIHIAHILDARGIEYEAQAKTENGKKPDFLFPSQAAYEDPAFPEEQLRMLASKTSIKDRFRQVADEANRIRDKHLFTLTPGDVTHPKLAQLDELHIHLVMPKVVKESYDDLIQGETMTFSRFIEEIQGLQADRPQSLTLL